MRTKFLGPAGALHSILSVGHLAKQVDDLEQRTDMPQPQREMRLAIARGAHVARSFDRIVTKPLACVFGSSKECRIQWRTLEGGEGLGGEYHFWHKDHEVKFINRGLLGVAALGAGGTVGVLLGLLGCCTPIPCLLAHKGEEAPYAATFEGGVKFGWAGGNALADVFSGIGAVPKALSAGLGAVGGAVVGSHTALTAHLREKARGRSAPDK